MKNTDIGLDLTVLAAVIIIGVLGAIAFPLVQDKVQQPQENTRESEYQQREDRYVNKCIPTGLTRAQCILRFTEIEMGANPQPMSNKE